MDLPAFLAPAVVVLAAFVVPARLLRRPAVFSANDDAHASIPVGPRVIRNGAVAYGCGLAALAPLFAWGAGGRFASAIAYAFLVGCGLFLAGLIRRPLIAAVSDAPGRGRAAGVHGFLAGAHGDDGRVRAAAAALTAGALTVLLACQLLALASVLAPLLAPGGAASEPALQSALAGVLAVVSACVIGRGPAVSLHAGQLLLGVMYLGLFAATSVLLYLQMSELGSVPAAGRFAIALIAVCCTLIVVCRRVRYVDTALIVPHEGARPPALARAVGRLAKIVNVLIAVFAGLALGFAVVELHVAGIATVVRDGAALLGDTRPPGMALMVLVLWPLLHPMVDAVNWQTVVAFEQRDKAEPGRGRQSGHLAARALEVAAVVLMMFLAAAVAGLGDAAPQGAVFGGLVRALMAHENLVARAAVWLLAVCLCAMAAATMGALIDALRRTVRHDIVPALRRRAAAPALEASANAAAAGGVAAAFAVFSLAHARYGVTLSSHGFLALVFAASCLQMALLPLVLKALAQGARAGRSPPSADPQAAGSKAADPRAALAVMAAGAVAGGGAVGGYALSGYEAWLWAAVPACLGSGALTLALAGLAGRPRAFGAKPKAPLRSAAPAPPGGG